MLDNSKRILQQLIGITDEDFNKHISSPNNRKRLERRSEMEKYQIVAEASQANYCSAGVKPGMKMVFNLIPALMIAEKSDCPLCVRAICPIYDVVAKVTGMIREGNIPDRAAGLLAECLDPGLEKGGLGHVSFKVYARKIMKS